MPSLKLISATDTEYSTTVLKSLNNQRHHGLFCDITIIIRDRKFRAHKTILSASSTYFHHLFTVAGQVIELNFIRAEIFEEVLNYIYTSKIVRVRSDMLEELIQAGKILGVKFIANLASPLAHVKGLPGLSKEPEGKMDTSSEIMPIITESFSISSEEFNQSSISGGNDEDSDSDVMFVSHTAANQKINAEVIDLESADSLNTNNDDVQQDVIGSLKTYSVKPPHSGSKVSSPMHRPDSNSNNLSSPGSAPTAPTKSTGFTPDPSSSSLSAENTDIMGVHNKKEAAADQHGDLNASKNQTIQTNTSMCDTGAKQTVTLKTAAEIGSIGSISPDCRVYANIGENTYDIVTMKNDPGEGGSKTNKGKRTYMATLTKASDKTPDAQKDLPKIKKGKTDLEDHYELVMDGKTFYVCVVCKRPYVCLTSLRRHFNTHSWEKKYPCRHCNKVFALAEYRTKHELTHTGERRYQCLLCNQTFMNYQFLSNHCKQIHNQDPSGKKEKDDTDNNLYRLLPCKTVKMKAYSWVTDETSSNDVTAVMSEDGSVHHIDTNQEDCTQRTMLNWDDIFIEPDTHSANRSNKRETEFDFVIPETY